MPSERQISVGGVKIGGGAPVVVQSMTLTPTRDVEATTAQIAALASAGCEIARCAVPKTEDAEALRTIVPKEMTDALVASMALQRLGTVDDMVGPALFLLSERAKWITGVILNVDGAQILRA